MNNQQIKYLADSMNVSVSDLVCFARATANGLEQDNIVDVYLSSDGNNRRNLSLAYANYAVRQMDLFVYKLKTNDEAASLFCDKVLNDLQEKIAITTLIERTEKYLNDNQK